MTSSAKTFDSLVDAKLYHMCEQMLSDVLLIPTYDVLTDSYVEDGFMRFAPNGKIQYSHKRHFIKYKPKI
jgi:hypothetical protein